MNAKPFLKSPNRLIIALIALGTGLVGVTTVYTLSQAAQQTVATPATTTAAVPQTITALGRIEPRTEIVSISAPMLLNADRVAKLLVDEGDSLKIGQVLAILESRDRLEDNLQQAEEEKRIAESKLAQVKAGAKAGEIEANSANVQKLAAQWLGERETQKATVRRWEAQLAGDRAAQEATIRKLTAEYGNAQAEFDRYERLYREGAISASSYDAKRLSLETSRQQLNEAKVTLARLESTGQQQIQEAKATLARIESTGQQQVREAKSTLNQVSEVREVDVKAAQAEIDSAEVAVKKARTELAQTYIRSPIAGKVVKVHTRVGEKISDQGILDIAETDRMEVIAEIYQSDIRDIRVGQTATITGSAFAGKITGKVRLIGLQVDKQDIFSDQPGENLDRKVIEVRIALTPSASRQVAGLTNSQVTVSIDK